MPTRQMPADVADTVKNARQLVIGCQAKIEQAGKVFRDTAKLLDGQGWTQVEIAAALGLSKQRVSQYLNPPKKTAKS